MQVSWKESFKDGSRTLQECFKEFEGVSRGFQRSSKDDSRMFYENFLNEVSIVFLESFKGVAKSFWCGSFRGVLRVFQRCFKKVSRVFQECF